MTLQKIQKTENNNQFFSFTQRIFLLILIIQSFIKLGSSTVPCPDEYYANDQYCFQYADEIQEVYSDYEVEQIPTYTYFGFSDPLTHNITCTLGKKKVNGVCSYYSKSYAYLNFTNYTGLNSELIKYCLTLDTPDYLTSQYKSQAGCLLETNKTLLCQECISGYGKLYSLCRRCQIDYCTNCDDKLTECKECDSGYYLSSYQCLVCSQNCISCESSSICSTCDDGYYLVESSSTSAYCTTCSSHCISCYVNSQSKLTCTKCGNQDEIYYYPNDQGSCVACNASNSLVLNCSGDPAYKANILSCVKGYYLVSQVCTKRVGTGLCLTINSKGMCTSCMQNTKVSLYLSAGNCVTKENCIDVTEGNDDATEAVCNECSQYSVYNTTDKQCHLCADTTDTNEKCKCTQQYVCKSCALLNYLISSDKRKCEEGNANVESYDQDTQEIDTCKEGYKLTTGIVSSCEACASTCSQCIQSGSEEVCLLCNDYYWLNSDNECESCPGNCISCSSNSKCTKCDTGYILLSSTTYTCQKYIDNCAKQKDESGKACLQCNTGFAYSTFSYQCTLCNATISNCVSCSQNKSTTASFSATCDECDTDYTLYNNNCIQISNCQVHLTTDYGCNKCDFGYYYYSDTDLKLCKDLQAALQLDSSSVSIDEKCPDLTESETSSTSTYDGDDLDVDKEEDSAFIILATKLITFLIGIIFIMTML